MQCPHFDAGECRSCPLMGVPYARQLADKQAAVLAGLADVLDAGTVVEEPFAGPDERREVTVEVVVVEGAGAAGLAAVLRNPARFAGKTIGLALCGGNIDTRLLANVLLRDLARQGRLARLRITLQDRPGALFRVMRLFDEHNVNII